MRHDGHRRLKFFFTKKQAQFSSSDNGNHGLAMLSYLNSHTGEVVQHLKVTFAGNSSVVGKLTMACKASSRGTNSLWTPRVFALNSVPIPATYT